GVLTPITGTPPYASDRNWRADPDGNAIVFDAVENEIAVERDGRWTTGQLPQPAATEVRPYVKDVGSNGPTVLAVSAWGVHRSTDGGASWSRVTGASDPRDVLVLADGRFIVINAGPA